MSVPNRDREARKEKIKGIVYTYLDFNGKASARDLANYINKNKLLKQHIITTHEISGVLSGILRGKGNNEKECRLFINKNQLWEINKRYI